MTGLTVINAVDFDGTCGNPVRIRSEGWRGAMRNFLPETEKFSTRKRKITGPRVAKSAEILHYRSKPKFIPEKHMSLARFHFYFYFSYSGPTAVEKR